MARKKKEKQIKVKEPKQKKAKKAAAGKKKQPLFNFSKGPKAVTPKTNQEVMKMMFRDFEKGIMRIDDDIYSMTFEYDDISFVKANDEEAGAIFLAYVDFLNSFNPKTHIQISNVATPVNAEAFKQQFVFDPDLFDSPRQKQLATEFNQLIDTSVGLKDNILINRRFITISQQCPDYRSANLVFQNLYRHMEEKFKDLHSSLRPVSMEERLTILHDFWNIRTLEEKGIEKILPLIEKGEDIFDLLAPVQNMDLKNTDYIEMHDPDDPDGVKPSRFIRSMYVDPNFPTAISPKFYNMITSQDDLHMISTINIQPQPTTGTLKKLRKQKSGLETERHDKIKRLAKQGMDYAYVQDDKLEASLQDVNQLIEDIQYHDQKIFCENIMISLVSDSYEQLEEETAKLQNVAGEMLINVHPIKWQQLEGIQNTLPLGHNTFQIQHRETSEATAIHVPFSAKEFLHPQSVFFGTNMVSRNPIFLDRTKLINGNGCILATSGAGKSFNVKTVAEEVLLRYPKDEVIFIDFQREYQFVVDAFDGQIIEISDSSRSHINPLDMSGDYSLSDDGQDTPLKAKTEYMQAWVESIVDEGALTAIEKSIIDRTVRLCFREYEASGYTDKSKQPMLIDFYNTLMDQPEIEALKLGQSLERFVTGSLDLFAQETNVDIKNRVVSFDVSGIPESIRTAGYLVILDHIMNRLVKNRASGINTWVFIDEFHILLANPAGAAYVAKLVKIGRKYNAFITVITQNVSDVYDNESGRKILANAEFALILKQSTSDMGLIKALYDISDGEASYFASDAKRGQGVIVYGPDKIPFYNPIPREYLIYELNNTDKLIIQKT